MQTLSLSHLLFAAQRYFHVAGLQTRRVPSSIPTDPSTLGIDIAKLLTDIRQQKTDRGAASLLDLISEPGMKSSVTAMADRAFTERGVRGGEAEKSEFREKMALGWLAKRRAFDILAKAGNFTLLEAPRFVSNSYRGSILAITTNGSIVAIGPRGVSNDKRLMLYSRIEERESRRIPPFFRGRLTSPVRFGESVDTSKFSTSPIIAMATKENAELQALTVTATTLMMACGEIERRVSPV